MGLFKTSSVAGRSRPDQQSPSRIRGKISGPIPIDEDEFPMRTPGSGIAIEVEPNRVETGSPRSSVLMSQKSSLGALQGEKTRSMGHRHGPSQASSTPNPLRRQTDMSGAIRDSVLSGTTGSDMPSRKKSSLRSAIGKIFGRKKKGSRSGSDSEPQPAPTHQEPTNLARDSVVAVNEPKRSASLPLTDFNRALRSHSIGPDDFIAVHSARNSLQTEATYMRRRAATTSDGFSFGRLKDEGVGTLGLSPRPASAQGREMLDDTDPDTIGRAVSGDMMNFRRRSRSLSQLPDTSEGQGLVRNRSQEIKFWRESYDPGALSPDLSTSNDKSPEYIETPRGELPPGTPPQPFNFGPLINMRITEAASLEDRITHLEERNHKLEELVSRIIQSVPGAGHLSQTGNSSMHAVAQGPGASVPASSSACPSVAQDSDPRPSGYSQSIESFEDSQTFVGSIHPPMLSAPRPTSNITIRGATSLPTLPRMSSGDMRALLETERAAREALEHQVSKLTHMVDILSRTTHQTPNTSVLPTQVSVFEHDDDDDDDEEEPLSASVDDDDAFKTPREEYEPAHGFGAFGEALYDDEDDPLRKKAARTLSLSQLTLGKPKKKSQKTDPTVDL